MTTTSVIDENLLQTTPNVDADDETFEATVRVVVPIVFGLVTVVGLVGNLLVIAVALRHKTRNTTNVLIVGLAVADLALNPSLISYQYALLFLFFLLWSTLLLNTSVWSTSVWSSLM